MGAQPGVPCLRITPGSLTGRGVAVDPPLTMQYQKINSFGVTAPIGVSISRGHSVLFAIGTGEKGWKKGTRGWASTLFFSIVDLGAITAFRFQNDSVASIPTIRITSRSGKKIFFISASATNYSIFYL